MAEDRPGYSFDPGPPPEASRYMAHRGLQPGFSWRDVEPEEHAVAFSVAKMMDLDLLQATHDELRAALDRGLPFAEFQRRLRPRLQARGWWSLREVTDPLTGEVVEAELGSPRRLRQIYETNLRAARAAGQWERIQRTRDALPYLEYRLGPSERHRPAHEARNFLVLPVDDPFWQSWYPPNGWNCRCWVRQLTRRQAEARGISQSPTVETRTWTNARTGEVKQIPVGIDPGWERNPGARRQEAMARMLEDRLIAVPDEVRQVALRDIAGSWRVQRVLSGTAQGSAPIGVLPANVADALGAETRVVVISDQTAAKQAARHSDISADDYRRLPEIIASGVVLRTRENAIAFVERVGGLDALVAGADLSRLPLLAAVKAADQGRELYLTTFYQVDSLRYLRRLFNRSEIVRE